MFVTHQNLFARHRGTVAVRQDYLPDDIRAGRRVKPRSKFKAGQISAACTREKHKTCYKLDCPCDCHPKV